jgi:F-type H+-transporting ATPase subunit gamma
MKMVAASKLKKAQEQAEASQPYALSMGQMMARVADNVPKDSGPRLLVGTGKDDTQLLVVVTADRGLCGGFNSNLSRMVRNDIQRLEQEGKTVKIVCVGRKGHDVLRREFGSRIIKKFTGIGAKGRVSFSEADEVARYVLGMFEEDGNQFKSVLSQKPSTQQLIPFSAPEGEADKKSDDGAQAQETAERLHYDFEPDEQEIMAQLLPKNLGVQIFRALLDSAAGEQAARMTAMDNATRNAGDMINRLTLQYNRARQAAITKELIEIISGAEAI